MLDPYEATIDDYYKSMMQSIQYHNYLKEHLGGIIHDKLALKLYATQWFRNLAKLAKAMNATSTNARLNSRVSHLEGENLFELVKMTLDLVTRDELNSHWYDCVNFTIAKFGPTMTPFQCLKQ